MIRRPPRSTRTDTLFPYTTLFRSPREMSAVIIRVLRLTRSTIAPAIGPNRIAGSILATITRSEEHTSELQSLMRISYDVFCLKKKTSYVHYTINVCIYQHHHTLELQSTQEQSYLNTTTPI